MRVSIRFAAGLAALWAALYLAAAVHAQSTQGSSLLVLSKQDHTLSVVDPSSLKVVARMPVGNDPHEVIASTDGKSSLATASVTDSMTCSSESRISW